ncbi:hypothetical protein [Aneurinibacillus terranovensis]|uniref:hypothetical protein n=1 Tax=Aneurinibacillus terranovensis TaxID=278991 RepID=UPI0009D661AC|nr:hypothetical protein [Aneurinibacillus terranovensis]
MSYHRNVNGKIEVMMKETMKGVGWFLVALVTCPCHLVLLIPLLAGTAIGSYIAQFQTATFVILAMLFALSLYMGWRKMFREQTDHCCDVKGKES